MARSSEQPGLLREILRRWRDHHVARLGAALSYYAICSLVPLLAICLAITGEILGPTAARAELIRQLDEVFSAQGARPIQHLLLGVRPFSTTALGTATSFAVLLWGAHLVFSELKGSLNIIWGVRPRRHPITHFLLVRLVSLALISVFVLVLLTLVTVTTFLSAAARRAPETLPAPVLLLQGADFLISVGLTTLMLALIYKFLPDVKVAWRDVWASAPWTALLLATGKVALAAYFSRVNMVSLYGAAVSLIVALFAVFLYAQILLLGAVLTAARAARRNAPAAAGGAPA